MVVAWDLSDTSEKEVSRIETKLHKYTYKKSSLDDFNFGPSNKEKGRDTLPIPDDQAQNKPQNLPIEEQEKTDPKVLFYSNHNLSFYVSLDSNID
jgi:hypothetical protein